MTEWRPQSVADKDQAGPRGRRTSGVDRVESRPSQRGSGAGA